MDIIMMTAFRVHTVLHSVNNIFWHWENDSYSSLFHAVVYKCVRILLYLNEEKCRKSIYDDDDDGNHICIDIDKRINVLQKRFGKGLGTQISKKREPCCFLKDWILSSSCFVGKSGFLKNISLKKKSVPLHRYVVLPIKCVLWNVTVWRIII